MADDSLYEDRLKRYSALVAKTPDLELKGKKMPYTSMNGNMFSFLAPDGSLCFRLSSADCQAFMDTHGGEPVMQYGRVMKDYVAVPGALLDDTAALTDLFATCVANARILKPKPTKR